MKKITLIITLVFLTCEWEDEGSGEHILDNWNGTAGVKFQVGYTYQIYVQEGRGGQNTPMSCIWQQLCMCDEN
jgi:hypothetical protein